MGEVTGSSPVWSTGQIPRGGEAGNGGGERSGGVNEKINMAIIHKKVLREHFEKIISGKKRFELRLADFEINEGDTLVLEEWDKDGKKYTGRKIEVTATYILKTKDQTFWPAEEVEKYGFQIIQFEPKKQQS